MLLKLQFNSNPQLFCHQTNLVMLSLAQFWFKFWSLHTLSMTKTVKVAQQD